MGDAFGIYKQIEQGWWMYITYHIPNLDVEITVVTRLLVLGFYNGDLSKHKG
jgi:hypothetical protein